MSDYDSYKFDMPSGSPYEDWGDWAAFIMAAIDEVLAVSDNWEASDQPYVAENIEELRYILPLLSACVAALQEVEMKFFVLRHKQAQNTNGGATSSDSYNAVPLNEETSDPDSLVSLSSGVATIVAGTWLLLGLTAAHRPDTAHASIYDVTAGSRVANGIDVNLDSAVGVSALCPVVYPVVLTADRQFRLDVYTLTGRASNGLGVAANKAEETYAYLIGLKLA